MNPLDPKTMARRPAKLGRSLGFAALLTALFALPGLVFAADSVEEVRPLAADGSVSIENEFGDITIEGWNRNEVRVTGDLSDDVRELQISESGNGVRIRVDYYDRRNISGAELDVMVPAGASVRADSVSGDIEAGGISGQSLELRTVSGDIDADARVTRLFLNSVSGDIQYAGTSERVSVETVSGEIDLSGVSGEVEASTVSGEVTVHGGTLSRGEFESVSGDVELRVALQSGGRINVSSMSGDIDLYLPGDQEGEFSAQTFSGDIDSDFGSARDSSSRGPGRNLEHRQGDGGARFILNSFSGDIGVYRR